MNVLLDVIFQSIETGYDLRGICHICLDKLKANDLI